MNIPVSFPIAKLLKEKGFDEYCRLCIDDEDNRPLPFDCGNTQHKNSLHPYYSAPTISEVVMWLYEKYGIWIYSKPYDENTWFYTIIEIKNKDQREEYRNTFFKSKFNSTTEAYEAGIEYALSHLV